MILSLITVQNLVQLPFLCLSLYRASKAQLLNTSAFSVLSHFYPTEFCEGNCNSSTVLSWSHFVCQARLGSLFNWKSFVTSLKLSWIMSVKILPTMYPHTFPPCVAILWTPVYFTDMMLPPLSFQNQIVGLHVFSFSASNITMAPVARQSNVCFITTKEEEVDALVLRCLWSFPHKGLVSLWVLIFKPTLCSVSTWFFTVLLELISTFHSRVCSSVKDKSHLLQKGYNSFYGPMVFIHFTLQLS